MDSKINNIYLHRLCSDFLDTIFRGSGVIIYIAEELRSINLEKHITSVNIGKSRPAIDPCGTPNRIFKYSLNAEPTSAFCFLKFK